MLLHSTLMEGMLMCVNASDWCDETLEERLQRVQNIAALPDSQILSLLKDLINPDFLKRMRVDIAREVLLLTQQELELTAERRTSNRIFHAVRKLYESYHRIVQRRYRHLLDEGKSEVYKEKRDADPDFAFAYSLFQSCLERNMRLRQEDKVIGDHIEYLVRNELFSPEAKVRYRRIDDPTRTIKFWKSQLATARRRAEASAAQQEEAEHRFREQHQRHPVGKHFHLGLVGGSGPKAGMKRLNREKDRIADRNQARFNRMQAKRQQHSDRLGRVSYCEGRLKEAEARLEALNNRRCISKTVAAKLKRGDTVWDIRTQRPLKIEEVCLKEDRLEICCTAGVVTGILADFR